MSFFLNRRRPTFPGSCPPSIISAKELNYCVRDGNRCILFAIVTGLRILTRLAKQIVGRCYTRIPQLQLDWNPSVFYSLFLSKLCHDLVLPKINFVVG